MSYDSTPYTPGSYDSQGAGSGSAHDGDGDDLQVPPAGANDDGTTELQQEREAA